MVCLGAPNTGSWLEKFVNVGGWAMRNVPESRPFADFLELRSAGIKDLRFGYLQDEDWLAYDPDERLRNRAAPRRRFPGSRTTSSPVPSPRASAIRWRTPSATSWSAFEHSATGPLTSDGEPAGDARHIQGASHFHLLNHPRAYEHLRDWLSGGKATEPAAVCFDA